MPSYRSLLKLLLVVTLVTAVKENSIIAMPPPVPTPDTPPWPDPEPSPDPDGPDPDSD